MHPSLLYSTERKGSGHCTMDTSGFLYSFPFFVSLQYHTALSKEGNKYKITVLPVHIFQAEICCAL